MARSVGRDPRGVSLASSAPALGIGTTWSASLRYGRSVTMSVPGAGRSSLAGETPWSPTAPAAEAKRSSRESGAGAGPVSPVESSYNCPHQSSS
ncbi:hypothetical protein ABZ327_09855 [Streptomyces sp. NPDC006135]|uniref:hypothetical protein n=1 Tax=Streptomyces sp. NPDC006135 TaxID=3154577 RepID=UPI0033FE14C8